MLCGSKLNIFADLSSLIKDSLNNQAAIFDI